MNEIIEKFKNKKVLIWGFGREGKSTYNFLRKCFPDMNIDIIDKGEVNTEGLTNVSVIDYINLEYALPNYDIVMKSPGISVLGLNIKIDNIASQTDIFMSVYGSQVIGITGTKGKSTTTSLIHHVLKTLGIDTKLVGNIGLPCFDEIENINENTKIVYELSSHQLQFINSSPHIAVLLNFHQDHIDHYGSYEKYVEAKHNIYKNQTDEDILIANTECDNITKQNNVVRASMNGNAEINVVDNAVHENGNIIDYSDTTLLGEHNLYNIGIASYICCDLLGINIEDFKKGLKTFNGLPHRMEFVGLYDDVKYYNDSISTIPAATRFAVESIPDIDTVLIGGMDRGIEYDELVDYLVTSKVKNIVLMSDTGPRIFELFINKGETYKKIMICNTLSEAVDLAKMVTEKGRSCLMSPAAASKNEFKDFEERGEVYKQLVKTV